MNYAIIWERWVAIAGESSPVTAKATEQSKMAVTSLFYIKKKLRIAARDIKVGAIVSLTIILVTRQVNPDQKFILAAIL